MSEVDEVAMAIYEQHPEFFPIKSRKHALSIATGQMPDDSFTMINLVADALLELSNA
jgi:hypothetical protein